MNKTGDLEKGKNIKRIFKGSIVSIIITIMLLAIFAVVLTYTNLNENSIPVTIIIISGISILIGSRLSTTNIKKNGILNGAMVGAIYIFSLYIISSIITSNFIINQFSIIMIITAIFTGSIGGIFSVNHN